jgi:hypothetical protein
MDSDVTLRRRARTSPGLPGPCLSLSTRALPNHPERFRACVCSLLPHGWQASPLSAGWPPPLVSRGRIGFACAGLARSLSRRSPVARPALFRRTDPFRAVGCPQTPDRSYMVNEQFTWLTPRSQQDRCGLPGAPKTRNREIPWFGLVVSWDPRGHQNSHDPRNPLCPRVRSERSFTLATKTTKSILIWFRAFVFSWRSERSIQLPRNTRTREIHCVPVWSPFVFSWRSGRSFK